MQHEVQQHQLVGGSKLLTVQIPNTITYYWSSYFRAGWRFVPNDQYELPHLAEHLAFAGTRQYPDPLIFQSEVERDGTYFNAHTAYDWVWYDYAGSRDGLQRILPLNMSQIYEPLYKDEKIAQEKNVITQELGQYKENDNWRAGYNEMRELYPQRNPDIDERIKGIPGITQGQIRDYHEKYYGSTNTSFVLSGDYSDAEVGQTIDRLNEMLKGRPQGKLIEAKFEDPVAPKGKILTLEPYRERQSVFILRFILPGYDLAARPALRTLTTILTGGLSARLIRKAREQGLTYGISAGSTVTYDGSSIVISSQTSLDKLAPLIELAAAELKAVGEGEYSEDELDRAMGFLVGNVRRSNQTPAALASWYDNEFLYGEEFESPEQWVEKLQAVTRHDIEKVYRKYVQPENMMLTMVGKDLDNEKANYQKLLAKYFGVQSAEKVA
jgi:zinc protease